MSNTVRGRDVSPAEVLAKIAAAQEVEITTAEDYKWNDDGHYKMGRLLITSIYLEDVGMVG